MNDRWMPPNQGFPSFPAFNNGFLRGAIPGSGVTGAANYLRNFTGGGAVRPGGNASVFLPGGSRGFAGSNGAVPGGWSAFTRGANAVGAAGTGAVNAGFNWLSSASGSRGARPPQFLGPPTQPPSLLGPPTDLFQIGGGAFPGNIGSLFSPDGRGNSVSFLSPDLFAGGADWLTGGPPVKPPGAPTRGGFDQNNRSWISNFGPETLGIGSLFGAPDLPPPPTKFASPASDLFSWLGSAGNAIASTAGTKGSSSSSPDLSGLFAGLGSLDLSNLGSFITDTVNSAVDKGTAVVKEKMPSESDILAMFQDLNKQSSGNLVAINDQVIDDSDLISKADEDALRNLLGGSNGFII